MHIKGVIEGKLRTWVDVFILILRFDMIFILSRRSTEFLRLYASESLKVAEEARCCPHWCGHTPSSSGSCNLLPLLFCGSVSLHKALPFPSGQL